jgi:hypothetical protein
VSIFLPPSMLPASRICIFLRSKVKKATLALHFDTSLGDMGERRRIGEFNNSTTTKQNVDLVQDEYIIRCR